MASPWKLLARLVSPRRQQRQEHGSADGVKPDVLAIAKPTERAANNELDATDGPADKKPVPHGHSAAVLAVPDYSEETASAVDGRVNIDGARPVEAPDPALSDEANTAAHAAPRVFRVGEGQTRKRRKKAKMSAVVLRPSSNVSTASDDAFNLDEEISLLRDQLARKLQMQNALLRRMLERFEY